MMLQGPSRAGARSSVQQLTLLLVEDNPSEAYLIQEELHALAQSRFQFVHERRLEEAFERIREARFDAVLLDLGLPDCSGLETVERMVAHAPRLPLLVLTGTDDDELGLQAVRRGAQDYLLKSQIDGAVLARAIRYACERKRGEIELMEARDQLQRAKEAAEAANRAKSQFLNMISHELRTPLNSILGFSSLMLDCPGQSEDEQHEYLKCVRQAGKHLLSLIDDMLHVTRVEAGAVHVDREWFGVGTLILDTMTRVRPLVLQRGLTASMDVEEPDPQIYSDRRLVHQVLLKLIDNALRFTSQGGIQVKCSADDGHVRIDIRDTGMGIRPADLERVFEPFQQVDGGSTRHAEGTGLGLFICKRNVQVLEGRIEAQSRLGEGSTFSVILPIMATEAIAAGAGDSPAAPLPQGRATQSVESGTRFPAGGACWRKETIR